MVLMNRRLLPIALVAVVAVLGMAVNAGNATAKDDAQKAVSFRRDVAPVITLSCTTSSCHGGGGRSPVLERHADPAALRAALVGVASEQRPSRVFVRPGAPDQSYLIQKIEGHLIDAECTDHDCGAPMPLDNPSLSADARAKIRTWIAQGARDN